ncbi:unnamed protein product [Linum tenue]|uniref:AIG1-type G domain-containing protein n=1 Tax=Linum tenue TaxID=586396 RepID=A0AAV0HUL4_9ROSI|nr:unnamed protein product [Linum tenue]
MKGIMDWVFPQLLVKSLASLSPGGFSGPPPVDQRADDIDLTTNSEALPLHSGAPCSIESRRESGTDTTTPQQVVEAASQPCNHYVEGRKTDPLARIEDLKIKLFRLLQRFSLSSDNLLVAKVLYRIHIATSIRAEPPDRVRNARAKAIAAAQESSGSPELDFSLRILVLGKTGVGKSATINSLLDERKTITSAFQPATDRIQEISGSLNGVRVTFIDTPGFSPSSTSSVRRNRKIMLSVKRFIRRSPPDIVLFVERLDLINMGSCDFPLLKLMTDVFGNAIWFNTLIVMTHASSSLPEGTGGYPVSYESYVNRCSELMQHYIHEAVLDSKLENPVILVENHPQCVKNTRGDAILPNGQVWRSHFMLLCICSKVLSVASNILRLEKSIDLGAKTKPRVPSLPHLLSSFVKYRSISNPTQDGGHDFYDEILLSDEEGEDEYDQLPPIRILSKSQFSKLSKSHKHDYLDELDYRETLYLKKQLKEECRRRREKQLVGEVSHEEGDESATLPEAVLLPDMVVPLSFDSDCHVHRYRCLVTNEQFIPRPVLDPQGWDHDVGFDGINLETSVEMRKNLHASVSGQMSKDKQNFNIQSECTTAYSDPRGSSYSVGLNVQSAGKDMFYTVHGNTRMKNFKHNVMDCGVSLTSFGKKYYVGGKVEDSVLVGKRWKFLVNAAQMRGAGQVAYGGRFEATVLGTDYPARNDCLSVFLSPLSFEKDTVLSGGVQSEFQAMRGTRVGVNVNLNSLKMGQVGVKISSSEHLEIALIAAFTIFRAVFSKRVGEHSQEELETG